MLTLYAVIEPKTLTKSFGKPSLSFYYDLMQDHRDKLQCPCSLISSPYNPYVQIQPVFHQVRKENEKIFRLIFPLDLFE